jgi:hypothetical protein
MNGWTLRLLFLGVNGMWSLWQLLRLLLILAGTDPGSPPRLGGSGSKRNMAGGMAMAESV